MKPDPKTEHEAIEKLLSKCRPNKVSDHPNKRTGIMLKAFGASPRDK